MKKIFILITMLMLALANCAERPVVDINGTWQYGKHSTVNIKNYKAIITAKNGESISATVSYSTNGTVTISRLQNTPEFIANYTPTKVANTIYTNSIISNMYFSLTKKSDDILDVLINAWQVFYDKNFEVYYIEPYTNSEIWTRVAN